MTQPAAVAFHVSQKVFALEGETRVNLLRLAGLMLFYGVHLVNRYGVGMSSGASVELMGMNLPVFDTVATAVTIAWGTMGAAVLVLLRTDLFRRFIAPVVTLADLAFLLSLLLVGNGPKSPMILVFFLIIAASGMRGRREMVWLATLGSLASYGLTVGTALWQRPDMAPPSYHILIVCTALIVAGVVSDALVGSFWRLLQQHVTTVDRIREVGGEPLTVPERIEGCPWCGAAVGRTASRCSRCEQPLTADAPFATSSKQSMLQAGPVHVGWAASVVLFLPLCVAVGIGIAVDWPALLIPYIGGAVLMMVALGRLLQLDLRKDEDDAAIGRAASTLGTAAATLALGATAVMVLLGVAVLVVVAMFIVVFALCVAVITANGGFNPH